MRKASGGNWDAAARATISPVSPSESEMTWMDMGWSFIRPA